MSIQLHISDQQQLLFYLAPSQKITIFSLTYSLLMQPVEILKEPHLT